MENNNIKKSLEFLKKNFDESKHLNENPINKDYRYQHILRVANIASIIANEENLDEEVTIIGALLHDIAYIEEFGSKENWLNHGRRSAELSEDFLRTLTLTDEKVKSILEGIAMHVDDDAKQYYFNGSKSAQTIGESDNIDRFDAYRNIESYYYDDFPIKTTLEKTEYLKNKIKKLKELRNTKISTKTAEKMWKENLDYQIGVGEKLLNQLQIGYDFEQKYK